MSSRKFDIVITILAKVGVGVFFRLFSLYKIDRKLIHNTDESFNMMVNGARLPLHLDALET